MIATIIASLLGAGGGLTAIITFWQTRSKENKMYKKEDIDDRIAEWKKIAEKHEEDMKELKTKYDMSQVDIRSLELYIRELIVLLAKNVPALEIPSEPEIFHNKK